MNYRLLRHRLLLTLLLTLLQIFSASNVVAQNPCELKGNCPSPKGNVTKAKDATNESSRPKKSEALPSKRKRNPPKTRNSANEIPVTTQSVSGQIKGLDGTPLVGVTVTAEVTKDKKKYNQISTVTDNEGNYKLTSTEGTIVKVTPIKDEYIFRPRSSPTKESTFEAVPLCTESRSKSVNDSKELSPIKTAHVGTVIPQNAGCDPITFLRYPYYYHEYKLNLKDTQASYTLKVEAPPDTPPLDIIFYRLVDDDKPISMKVAGEDISGLKGTHVIRIGVNNIERLPFEYSLKLIHNGITAEGYKKQLEKILSLNYSPGMDDPEVNKMLIKVLDKGKNRINEMIEQLRNLKELKKADEDKFKGDFNNYERLNNSVLST